MRVYDLSSNQTVYAFRAFGLQVLCICLNPFEALKLLLTRPSKSVMDAIEMESGGVMGRRENGPFTYIFCSAGIQWPIGIKLSTITIVSSQCLPLIYTKRTIYCPANQSCPFNVSLTKPKLPQPMMSGNERDPISMTSSRDLDLVSRRAPFTDPRRIIAHTPLSRNTRI